jgi:hypothetical protein
MQEQLRGSRGGDKRDMLWDIQQKEGGVEGRAGGILTKDQAEKTVVKQQNPTTEAG